MNNTLLQYELDATGDGKVWDLTRRNWRGKKKVVASLKVTITHVTMRMTTGDKANASYDVDYSLELGHHG